MHELVVNFRTIINIHYYYTIINTYTTSRAALRNSCKSYKYFRSCHEEFRICSKITSGMSEGETKIIFGVDARRLAQAHLARMGRQIFIITLQ